MALRSRSLFLYGYTVTVSNGSIDFKAVSSGPTLQATLNVGYYSLTSLMAEIVRAMQAADTANTYTVTANRTISGGMENRISISTSSTFLSLLFNSGPRAASSIATLAGFNSSDYTGATSYTGSATTGTQLSPDYVGYNFIPPTAKHKVFGNVNISASGLKEAIVFNIQKFFEVQFKYEPDGPDDDPLNLKVTTYWQPLLDWMISQKPLEFTPEISKPTVFYQGTLERTSLDYNLKEMKPDFPSRWDMGLMTFRQIE